MTSLSLLGPQEGIEWIKNQLTTSNLALYNSSLWNSSHDTTISEFLQNHSLRKIFVYVDNLDSQLYIQYEIPKYYSGEFLYFVKLENVLESINYPSKIGLCFLYAKVKTDNPIESLYSFMTGDYLANLFHSSKWPESTNQISLEHLILIYN